MNKTLDPKSIAELSRYTTEELDPSLANDDRAVDEFINRNREALNKALEAGYVSLKSGRGVAIHSLDELLAALEDERKRAKHQLQEMAQYVLSPEALRDLLELQSFLTERKAQRAA